MTKSVGKIRAKKSLHQCCQHLCSGCKYPDAKKKRSIEVINSSSFFSFSESRVAQSLFGKDHVIKGISCHIGQAKPKSSSNQSGKTYRDDRGGGRDDDRRDYGGPRGFAEYAGLATDNAIFFEMPFSWQRPLICFGD